MASTNDVMAHEIFMNNSESNKTPKEMLETLNQALMESSSSSTTNNNNHNQHNNEIYHNRKHTSTTTTTTSTSTFHHNEMALPESVRWALCGIKNLTVPPIREKVCERLIYYGVIPLLLDILKVDQEQSTRDTFDFHEEDDDDVGDEDLINDNDDSNIPYHWDCNSIQDTALYILMNLALCESTKSTLYRYRVEEVLSQIAQFSSSIKSSRSHGDDQEKQKDLQCLKAVSRRTILLFIFFCIYIHVKLTYHD